jgi:predicted DNA-binding transcriptional regulator AlpA
MGPDAVLSAAATLLSAEAAAQRLGVSRATLYAYVSRGLLTAVPDAQDAHASRYSSFEIDLLVRRKRCDDGQYKSGHSYCLRWHRLN